MTQSGHVNACKDLLAQLSSIDHTESQASIPYEVVAASLDHAISLSSVIAILTPYVAENCKSGVSTTYRAALLATLADATRRDAVWRSLFGPYDSRENRTDICILGIVREVVAEVPFQDPLDTLNSCLRLVANCCADNNRNRKYFITQTGLTALISCLKMSLDPDLLIPTIYNVCNDYEEPELDIEQTSANPEHPSGNQVNASTVSLAARELAATCADHEDVTTFGLLLAQSASLSKERLGFLAALVELAALSATEGMSYISGGRANKWCWSFVHHNQTTQTLESANKLADESTECRVSVLRAVLYILSQEEARQALLKRHDDSILQLVRLASFPSSDEDFDEFEEEVNACQKEFFKIFYDLTGSPEFVRDKEANMVVADTCLRVLSEHPRLSSKSQRPQANGQSEYEHTNKALEPQVQPNEKKHEVMTICALIILAQLSVNDKLREKLLGSESLLDTISSILNIDSNPDMLYPTTTLVTRLAISSETSHILLTDPILYGMKRLIAIGGLGLIIPYEIVNAYRILFKGRPDCLSRYTHDPGDGSIVSKITMLFDRTIEAGTKLAVGHFFIELLRTIFPSFKDVDDSDSRSGNNRELANFNLFMNVTAVKIAEILTFVCTQAEPKEQRIHGWFGLAMLSVWMPGRVAIVNAIEHQDLDQGITHVAHMQDGPACQNLKLMLTKMQSPLQAKTTGKTARVLDEAARILNMKFDTA